MYNLHTLCKLAHVNGALVELVFLTFNKYRHDIIIRDAHVLRYIQRGHISLHDNVTRIKTQKCI